MKSKLITLVSVFTLLAIVGLTAVSQADTDTQAPTATITATDEMEIPGGSVQQSTKMNTSLSDIKDDTGVVKIECFLNDVLMLTDCKNGGEPGISLETKDYKNGTYYLSFKLYDAAGNVGFAKTYAGKTKLTFHVNNKAVTPAPAPAPTPQAAPACSGKQTAIDRITKRITDRHKQQLDNLDDTRDKITTYYDAQDQKLEDFDSLASKISEKAEAATAAVEDLATAKVVCDAQAQTSLDTFKSANALVMEKVREYRLALLDLVHELEDL